LIESRWKREEEINGGHGTKSFNALKDWISYLETQNKLLLAHGCGNTELVALSYLPSSFISFFPLFV
jgi:hypothetical protein